MKSNEVKTIIKTGMGIALYVVCSMFLQIPIVNNIHLDIGYLVLGVFCCILPPYQCAIIASVGCCLESLLVSGWIPYGWVVGNYMVGLILGYTFKMTSTYKNELIRYLSVVLSVVLGILMIKTIIECYLFSIPLEIKLISNGIASFTDAIVLFVSYPLGKKIKEIMLNQ